MEEKIKKLLEKEINPYLRLHAGMCEFIAYENGVLRIKLKGSCEGCPATQITLYNGIIPIIKEKCPEIKEILIDS
jgi:Fe-S cluster biogenesis protein NfuA